MNTEQNLLFICSKNQWRSPTAEDLFSNHSYFKARSAGTSSKARIKVTEKVLHWAHVVLVMEKKHKELLYQKFLATIQIKRVIVLNIPDKYKRNDPALISILQQKLAAHGIEV
ncbi:low molecular weight protein tyrosine phosphatase family protein [Rufibacter roseus]|uniref:Low molecular weight protein tyrosine phosphatase family protein n=1 Tax=Rufibacter roseus TaxID=1567108 RepID=A0ABW2DJG8_9BACT|nr:hypothetical protein [Rufibacter roseus]